MDLELPAVSLPDPGVTRILEYGDIALDMRRMEAVRNHRLLNFKPFEFCILAVMLHNAGRICQGPDIYYAALMLHQQLYDIIPEKFAAQGQAQGSHLSSSAAKLLKGSAAADMGQAARGMIGKIRATLGEPGLITNYYGGRYKIELPGQTGKPERDSFPVLRHEDITLDLSGRRVTRSNTEIPMPDFRLCILAVLMQEPGGILTRGEIYERASALYKTLQQDVLPELTAAGRFLLASPLRVMAGESAANISNVVRVHIGLLRKALGEPNIIGTHGNDYRLETRETVAAPRSGLWSHPARPEAPKGAYASRAPLP